MDSNRFDAIIRTLARPTSRRRTLGAVVAAALAPAAARAKPAPAKCLAVGKRCSQTAAESARHGKGKHEGKRGGKRKHHPPSCGKCCSRFGAAGANGKPRCACKPEGADCGADQQCCGGLCRTGTCTKCPGEQSACNGACVDLHTNDGHCGDCATACANGQRCVDGDCVCDGESCPNGCCDDRQTCQRGTRDAACGVGGAGCRACAECTTCDGTQCVNAVACCGDEAACQSGTCVNCADGQRCQRGACVCDTTSCPDGCCDGDVCVSFEQQTDRQCGTGGQACRACVGHDTCGGGETQGVCGCTPATTCPPGQTCGTAPDGCGATIACGGCAGCCAGSDCGDGTSDAACGANGDPCLDCTQTGRICHDQACCTPEPAATTCKDKCGTVQNNCGLPVDCTARCAGCCAGNTCETGTEATACGTDGQTCTTCAGHDTCGGGGTEGVCGCTPTTCVKEGKNCSTIADGCGGTLSCGTCTSPETCGGGDPGAPNVCGCTPQCAGKPCGADNECGGTCPCPDDSPICRHNPEDSLICCCANGTSNAKCIANEDDPARVCCCSTSILTPLPRCLFSESGKACCCSNPQHVCTDAGCQAPPP